MKRKKKKIVGVRQKLFLFYGMGGGQKDIKLQL